MRELSANEVEEVSGAWVNILVGMAIGGVSACLNGGGAAQIIGSMALGGVSGMYGNFAGAAAGGAKIAFASKSFASGLGGAVLSSQ